MQFTFTFYVMLMIFFLQFFVSFYFGFKIYFLYKDSTSIQTGLIILLDNITIISSLLYYNANYFNIALGTLSFKIAILSLVLLIIIVGSFLDKNIYSSKTRILARFSSFLFTIVVGIVLSEIIANINLFFYLTDVSGQFVPYYELGPSFLIIFGGFLILLAVYSSYKDLSKISKRLLSQKSVSLILIASSTVLFAFMIDLIIQTVSINLLVEMPVINKDSIYFLHFIGLNLMSLSFAYFSYTQPFLTLTAGVRPNLLLKNGVLGYYLASHTDNGPEPLSYSLELVKNAEITEKSLLGLAVSSIVLVGMFREEDASFVSKVSLIPIPNMENYSAVVYTFVLKSTKITDDRIKENAPTVFAILFPSALSISIQYMNNTLKTVLEYCYKYETVEELNQPQHLFTLTSNILRKILL